MSTSNFHDLKAAVQQQFDLMKSRGLPMFRVDVDKDRLWELYQSSFPEGSNKIFRTRREYDCSCCRSFVKRVGNVVAVQNGQLISLWDVTVTDPAFQIVTVALSNLIHQCPVDNILLDTETSIGTDRNFENGASVLTWEHFHITLSASLVCREDAIGPRLSEARAFHDVFLRSLKEITPDAIETIRELIAQNSLYRGAEKKALVDAFAVMKIAFDLLTTDTQRDLFAWSNVQGPNAWVCKIRNDVIGTLLVDLSEGRDLEAAVKSFEDKVSGTNYKRPTALITPRMRDAARVTLETLGLLPALERRFAVLEDITINNILFADRDARRVMTGDIFDALPTKGQGLQSLSRVEEVPIDDFITNILPTTKSLELMFESRHVGNLVSLTAPCDPAAPVLFKWPNGFAWSYNGDVADSIKERVKNAGGNITGEVCCRLAWNNTDDLDFHMDEPRGYHIFFQNRQKRSPSGGTLDVDANGCDGVRVDPCENIFYDSQRSMTPGVYRLYVHQYAQRQTRNVGFDVEIDVQGVVYRFAYPRAVRQGEKIQIAELHVTDGEVKIVPKLESSQDVKDVWGMKTQDFQKVSTVMFSPNHWNGQGVGNKHYMFMLVAARNDGSARGFYNEFLSSSLEKHRKVMELVGSRMRTELSDQQLSGLGFSSTQRSNVLVRVTGSFTRIVKVVF